MRKQIDGPAQIVQALFAADALSGQFFVFLGKRRNKMKLLWWDRHGFFLLYKRLERGRFPRPETLARDGLTMAELMAFLEGIDLSRAKRLPTVCASRVARSIGKNVVYLMSTCAYAESLIRHARLCRPRHQHAAA